MKYAAMLRCADSTVMEVDLSTGIYHLVYIASEDFEPLRSGGNYKEALKNFTEKSVHTGDQGIVAGSSDNYIHDFVENGLLKHTAP